MLNHLFYCFILRKLNEISKNKSSFYLYDLLSSRNLCLGIPIDMLTITMVYKSVIKDLRGTLC